MGRKPIEYRGRIVDHEGNEVVPGTPAWERLSEAVSAMWGEAAAYRRDHPDADERRQR